MKTALAAPADDPKELAFMRWCIAQAIRKVLAR